MTMLQKCLVSSVLALLLPLTCFGKDDGESRAETLYEHGLWTEALNVLQSLPEYGCDPIVDGYATLCAMKLHLPGYASMAESYLKNYANCSLCTDIEWEMALDAFDNNDYDRTLELFSHLKPSRLFKKQLPEYYFKRGYSHFKKTEVQDAMKDFALVCAMDMNDYSAPAWYCTGYTQYKDGKFADALASFEKSAADERFVSISNYYIINCHYCVKDYDFVIDKGVGMFENGRTPSDRKAHLARIISESYLVKGEKKKAGLYFSNSDDGSQKTRADYFFAGSLMYSLGKYRESIENYAKMPEKTDSLGQIAWYQTALSYIALKNKVSALGAFQIASNLDFDRKMTEDAAFNYAKLAFDLNGDTRGFNDYCGKYADKVRGEQVFSYMALASLNDKDFQSAIDYYDKIEVLDPVQKNNYIHANYLRGSQLLDAGSYRNSVPYFKAVAFYSSKNDIVNQLARYYLAESYYRDARFDDAAIQYAELYNTSALNGLKQAENLPYDVAYSYYKAQDYESSGRWFDKCTSLKNKNLRNDALLRAADCRMAVKNYAEAAEGYSAAIKNTDISKDLYPLYQSALAFGLAGKDKNKLQLLEKVPSNSPTALLYSECMLELGKMQVADKRPSDAISTYRKLLEAAPEGPCKAKALLETGTIYRSFKMYDRSIACYKKVVEQYASYGYTDDALLAVESLYKSQGKPGEYLDYLASIGRGQSESDKRAVYFNTAVQLFYADEYAKASNLFREFIKAYPASDSVDLSKFYMAEGYRHTGEKIQACDIYSQLTSSRRNDLAQKSLLHFASLSYELENYEDAYKSWTELERRTSDKTVAANSTKGRMKSAWKLKDYKNAADASLDVLKTAKAESSDGREAMIIRAKSLAALGERELSLELLGKLSAFPKTKEGAEALYLLVQDSFDRGDFAKVVERVQAFAATGATNKYFLAKSFILLGDAYAEQGRLKQAKATFKSIADGYGSEKDEIMDEVDLRLDKLKEVEL